MPFLKRKKRREPWTVWAEAETFKTGLRHAIFTPGGDRYKGEWLKNEKSGKGAELKVSGYQYEGEWLRDNKYGWGKYSKWIEDEKKFELLFTGEHKNGMPHGFGYKHYKDGTYYEGEFKDGKRGGYGRCWYPNGSFYEGEWKNDKYHGNGMFVQANGNRYEGEFKLGVKEGWGRFYHLDSGQVQEGFWENNMAVTSFMEDMYYRQATLEPTEYPIVPHELQPDVPCLVFLNQAAGHLMKYKAGCQFHKYCYSRPVKPTFNF